MLFLKMTFLKTDVDSKIPSEVCEYTHPSPIHKIPAHLCALNKHWKNQLLSQEISRSDQAGGVCWHGDTLLPLADTDTLGGTCQCNPMAEKITELLDKQVHRVLVEKGKTLGSSFPLCGFLESLE